MSQNYYEFKLVSLLLQRENHIRELARMLGTNQTTAARKLAELYSKNVVEYKLEGRNKIYFLKRSLEAYQFVLIAEQIKLIEILREDPYLRRIAKEIKQNKEVNLAVLFGSHAKKTATRNSDIDIFIETKSKKIRNEINNINSRISVKVGEFDTKNLLIREILKNHVILKGAEIYYERTGFFEKT